MSDSCQAAVQTQSRESEGARALRQQAVTLPRARMEREMIELHQNVESLLPAPRRIIQFLSCRAGEGVSTVVREYAWVAAAKLGKSVLILDANHDNQGQRHFFDVSNGYGWDDAIREAGRLEAAICRVGPEEIHLGCSSLRHAANWQSLDPLLVKEFFLKIKERFDLALIDSSPLATGVDTGAVTRCADGVVLVVEAEKTRWPVLVKAKKKILKSGGAPLGAVFNKRINYIPEFIYARL